MDQNNGSNEEITIRVEETNDPLVGAIKKILETKSFSSSKCTIHRVPNNLRSVNPEAYTPQVISIGPFHYGKEDLKAMEEYKQRSLQKNFKSIDLDPVMVIEKVRSWEERARGCYAEPIDMSSDDFVRLLLVDGCFVVEYFSIQFNSVYDKEVHLLHGRLKTDLFFDLIKLENQLPFFVLEGLYGLHQCGEKAVSFFELIHLNLTYKYKSKKKSLSSVTDRHPDEMGRVHLLNRLWNNFIPNDYYEILKHHSYGLGCFSYPHPLKQSQDYLYPATATELYEAGVIFKKAENKCIEDVITGITLKNGVLKIPPIQIYPNFECYLRNLIAFEQHYMKDYYVTQFAMFMDDLINTDNDVSILIKAGIISNRLGSNEDVSKLFNNISKHVNVDGKNYFKDVCFSMTEYCKARRHGWMASLKHNYFNTPWAFISFVAAAVLLILTSIQTVFTVWK